MSFFAFGIDFTYVESPGRWHKKISVDRSALLSLSKKLQAKELFLHKSKNKLIVFALAERQEHVLEEFISFLETEHKFVSEKFRKSFFHNETAEAVQQFFKSAIGILDGEMSESIQEFRQNFELARDANLTGPYLHKLFQRGIWLSEKIRLQLNIKRSAITPESVVTDLALKIFGDLGDHAALIAATSEVCEDFVQNLQQRNIGRLFFLDHPAVDLRSLDERFGGKRVSDREFSDLLPSIDLILIFDDVFSNLIDSGEVARWMNRRNNAPLLLVSYLDLPQNSRHIQTELAKIYNLYHYTKDDLRGIVTSNLREQLKITELINQLIDREVDDYIDWLHLRDRYRFGDIIGKSQKMQKILELIAKIAQTDITVLIDGESGTGKELIAQAIHDHSTRAKNPFVVVNCGAMPESLLESELFGYVRGAFTGAVKNKKGLFEESNDGTIFLDEIGETSLTMQVKLLRFLQEGEIKPVGSNETIRLNVRLIAATNRDLQKMVEEGLFRQDLYYRLNVIQITVPPIRERREDILPLSEFFIKKYSKALHKSVHGLTKSAEQLLESYPWPGNVRELENAIERAVALSAHNVLTVDDFPPAIVNYDGSRNGALSTDGLTLKELEKNHIARMLKEHNWNYELVTNILGIGRTTLWRKMKEYHISAEDKDK